jgi:Peptidase C13 family
MRAWRLGLVMIWLLAGSALAQPQPRDPLNGQFGVIELAAPPAEAANLAKLMGAALTGLAPQRPGELDVYVISAALWGDPVFEREAAQAEEILRRRLGAAGRSIVLSAGGQGARRYPAATPDNIAAAIGQVGALIDPAEDLVVVFFTSHGSPDGSVAIREHNRLNAAMRPTHLRDMLAQAGVRNRVVIVSACFSGAFIAPLMDDDTVVLTASAPDRTSFGCQPQREWTFFGDAFFNRALREGASMIAGFDLAKRQIERWEREQNLSPASNPQRFVGARAGAMLRRAEVAAE